MTPPVILWLRRDFRLSDNAALRAAFDTGRPIIPVFILDPITEAIGAAPLWRLGEAVRKFAETLEGLGSRLILRRGSALDCLRELVAETGADTVYWSRAYHPDWVARDKDVKSALTEEGITAESHTGWLLFEPWTVATQAGDPYTVYTPFWNNVRKRDVAETLPKTQALHPPESWPVSDDLNDWAMGAAMNRGADVVAKYARVGEDAALDRLSEFADDALTNYRDDRNRPDVDATSGLSENLAVGEISPRTIWQRAMIAHQHGSKGAETFLKELVWREFAWHLMWHTPHIETRNWRDGWDNFPWRSDNDDAEKWRRGLTGEPMVDAGIRELFATGRMHNRVRMIVASYLTKHLLTDWRVGMNWFADTLIDWDPASNAMGWQWVAGSGPDAAPYFRIFNPATQAEKFDPDATYRDRFLHGDGAADFRNAIPRNWAMRDGYAVDPIVSLAAGRAKALQAYEHVRK